MRKIKIENTRFQFIEVFKDFENHTKYRFFDGSTGKLYQSSPIDLIEKEVEALTQTK
jgi:hypothetical protein